MSSPNSRGVRPAHTWSQPRETGFGPLASRAVRLEVCVLATSCVVICFSSPGRQPDRGGDQSRGLLTPGLMVQLGGNKKGHLQLLSTFCRWGQQPMSPAGSQSLHTTTQEAGAVTVLFHR